MVAHKAHNLEVTGSDPVSARPEDKKYFGPERITLFILIL
jgi:hypothetical protein